MKAIFTLADGTKVPVVSIHNPRATNDLEFWIEDPTLPGNQHRIFCPVGEEAERYSPVEITDYTPTYDWKKHWESIKRKSENQ